MPMVALRGRWHRRASGQSLSAVNELTGIPALSAPSLPARKYRLGYVDFHLSPDGGEIEITFADTAKREASRPENCEVAAQPLWGPIVELLGALSSKGAEELRLSTPSTNIKKYPNPKIVSPSIKRNVQSMTPVRSYWKTVEGRLHFRGWTMRSVDDNFVDVYLTPYSRYEGWAYVPPSRSAGSKHIANDILSIIELAVTKLVRLDLRYSGVRVLLGEPTWQKNVTVHGGDAFVYQGTLTRDGAPSNNGPQNA